MSYFGGAYDASPDSLTHYGVKGMKWGVRRAEKRAAKAAKKLEGASDDYKSTAALRKKKASELSNKELKALNERLNLEQQFSKLTAKPQSKSQKFVSDITRELAKETVKGIAKKNLTSLGESVMSAATKKRGSSRASYKSYSLRPFDDA